MSTDGSTGSAKPESCGRCSVTTVLDATEQDESGHDPQRVVGDTYIEVEETDLRRVAPHLFAMDKFQRWLDGVGLRLIYGKR